MVNILLINILLKNKLIFSNIFFSKLRLMYGATKKGDDKDNKNLAKLFRITSLIQGAYQKSFRS